jgi:phosphatidylserine/phosphatidylglycerophosphate/cardiolipin synthase-like enzyme
MNNLFLILFLLSPVGLVIGLIKPSTLKLKSRKDVSLIFGGAMVIFFMLFGITASPNSGSSPVAVDEPQAQTTSSPSAQPASPMMTANVLVSAEATPSNPVSQATSDISPSGAESLIIEPSAGMAPVLAAISGATKSIDLVMYEFEDPQIEAALATAEKRGVAVRVLLNQGYYGEQSTDNEAAYQYFQSNGVAVHWTPSYFALTHEKAMIIDGNEAMIMTFNFTPQYYASDRDFAVIDRDPKDVLAIESVFGDDWQSKQDTPSNGDDLVWSPGSADALIAMIDNAKKTLDIENEEMSDTGIVSALSAAAQRGVDVEVSMTYSSEYASEFQELAAAGVHISTYASSAPLYIHAKIIVADGASAFVGSENFSASSLDNNRELGIILSDQSAITSLSDVFQGDWSGGTPFVPSGSASPSEAMAPTVSSASASSYGTGVIKLSTTGICHYPGDPYYTATIHYTPYATIQACLDAGGRLPKN